MHMEADLELEPTNTDGTTLVLFPFAATPHIAPFSKELINETWAMVDKLATMRAKKVPQVEHEAQPRVVVDTVADLHAANATAEAAGASYVRWSADGGGAYRGSAEDA